MWAFPQGSQGFRFTRAACHTLELSRVMWVTFSPCDGRVAVMMPASLKVAYFSLLKFPHAFSTLFVRRLRFLLARSKHMDPVRLGVNIDPRFWVGHYVEFGVVVCCVGTGGSVFAQAGLLGYLLPVGEIVCCVISIVLF